ncbi:hypothetical protein [Gloeocapsopsis sp. IPPAS B-1203]|uniref:hypothetical protein n=1 Tax=Gloeocapsopsis sp. IPPAS B-1203 TaxID=2049454 RepID=UPI000C17736F|nr:hypothetical protein [Gloeocapsopsis sp. IPPAS B-1203]PIG94130.1 hypothetical protein CSQ79_07265 [Gloeocapsopsis sp. IPPAS B-1203]
MFEYGVTKLPVLTQYKLDECYLSCRQSDLSRGHPIVAQFQQCSLSKREVSQYIVASLQKSAAEVVDLNSQQE